ncbi:ABC transporter ATP-binding protein [Myroides phaeus]|uniref:ATP-binding cassette domain-containing protein n=1 Tax=Myroides phaeus TaxID=702745 RepID=UPI001303BD29|nr:ABC transporter ATP-binding protein [Myroides phaeus]
MSHQFQLDSLIHQIDNRTILHGVCLSAKTTDIIGIVGSNGTGKSTLLNILFGAIKATQIFIRVDNQVILNRHKLNKYFSYKPQFLMFPPNLKVKDLFTLEQLTDTPFLNHLDLKIKELSTGEQQFLQTLYVLNLPQPFCLLDEPFAAISPIMQEQLMAIIQDKSKDKCIILVDHYHDLLTKVCTKQFQLTQGSLIQITH